MLCSTGWDGPSGTIIIAGFWCTLLGAIGLCALYKLVILTQFSHILPSCLQDREPDPSQGPTVKEFVFFVVVQILGPVNLVMALITIVSAMFLVLLPLPKTPEQMDPLSEEGMKLVGLASILIHLRCGYELKEEDGSRQCGIETFYVYSWFVVVCSGIIPYVLAGG